MRLKQYYSPSAAETMKHSRVVTGLTTQHLYKEKVAAPTLDGAMMSVQTPRKYESHRKRKNSEKERNNEKEKKGEKKRLKIENYDLKPATETNMVEEEGKISVEKNHNIIENVSNEDLDLVKPVIVSKKEIDGNDLIKVEHEENIIVETTVSQENADNTNDLRNTQQSTDSGFLEIKEEII